MPSDPRVQLALDGLARPIGEFRSTIAGALAQAEAYLAAEEPDESAHVARVAAELGDFARDRIDLARFAAVAAVRPPLSVASVTKNRTGGSTVTGSPHSLIADGRTNASESFC